MKKGKGVSDIFEGCSALMLFRNTNKRNLLERHFRSLETPERRNQFLNKFARLTGTAGEWKLLSQKLSNETLQQIATRVSSEMVIPNQSTVAIDVEVSKEIKLQLNNMATKTKKSFWSYFISIFFRKNQPDI